MAGMDHDAPEQEELNLLEIVSIVRVQQAILDRACGKAAAAFRAFAEAVQSFDSEDAP